MVFWGRSSLSRLSPPQKFEKIFVEDLKFLRFYPPPSDGGGGGAAFALD